MLKHENTYLVLILQAVLIPILFYQLTQNYEITYLTSSLAMKRQ